MKTLQRKITILLPIHQSKHIELNFNETILSILKNINQNFVLKILVDGNLSNSFKKKISQYKKNKKILIIKSRKVGLANLLNIGINNTKTEWIARVDADDIYTSFFFKEGLKLVKKKKKPLDLFGGQITEFNNFNNSIFNKKVPTSEKDILSTIKFRNPFNHMTVFFRTSIAKQLGGYPDYDFKEDYGLWIKFISAGAKVLNSDKIFVRARISDNFYDRRSGFKHLISEIKIQNLLLKNKLTKIHFAILVFCIRILLILMPKKIIKVFYKNFLRY
jgi:glycosyltransferase involved in cell wall biosynthesis